MESKLEPEDVGRRRVGATWGDLARRIWAAVKANKALVAGTLLAATLHALLSKSVFLLAKPFMDAMADSPLAPGGAARTPSLALQVQDAIDRAFDAFATGTRDLLGIEFAGTAEAIAQKTTVFGCAVAAPLLGLLGAFAIYASMLLSRYFAVKVVVDIRNQTAGHILRLPLRFFSKRRMGDLLSSITNDTMVLSRAFMLAADHVVTDPLLLGFNFVVLLIYAPDLWWVFLVMLPVMALPMVRIGRRVRKSSSRSLAALGDSTEAINQMLSGIKTVKAFQLEALRQGEFEESNARYLHRTRRMLQAKGFSQGLLSFLYMSTFGAMLFLLGWWVIQGRYETWQLPLIVFPFATSYTHIKRLARAYNTLMESLGALEGVESILRVKPDHAGDNVGIEIDEVRGQVVFDNVSFAYEDEPVLRNVSFKVRAGQKVALVGPSGAGKTTAMDLLARFHDPIGGRVLVDGHDLRDIKLSSFRRHLAIVSQQPFLFNASIHENIRYGWPDATEEEIVAAARQAHIHDFIVSLPQGYNTVVGERGSNLSGGQMQRITIARAVVRNPSILLLDEATAALDSEIEAAVQTALDNLMQGRTSFIIAHRLATVRSADLILVMDEGRVVQTGTHEELTGRKGLYGRLSQRQSL